MRSCPTSAISIPTLNRPVSRLPLLLRMGETRCCERAKIVEIVEGVEGLYHCHNVYVRPAADGYDVVLHCLADSDLPVADAHRLADLAEKRIHADLPDIGHVLIHLEPDVQDDGHR